MVRILKPNELVGELERKDNWLRHDKGGWTLTKVGTVTTLQPYSAPAEVRASRRGIALI